MSRTCPRCELPLQTRASGGVEVDLCARCGGVWLDQGEFDRLIAERFLGKKLESQLAWEAFDVGDGALRCVSGCGVMSRVTFARVELDRCADCGGMWVDGDERGAFAKLAEHEQEAQKEELDMLVLCAGCGAEVLGRTCIHRMEAHWCEQCVVKGEYPGGTGATWQKRVAEASRSMAIAKARQERNRDLAREAARLKDRAASHPSYGLGPGSRMRPGPEVAYLRAAVDSLFMRLSDLFAKRAGDDPD